MQNQTEFCTNLDFIEELPTDGIGVASAASKGGAASRSFDALVERADGALYLAKQAGRDRIVVA